MTCLQTGAHAGRIVLAYDVLVPGAAPNPESLRVVTKVSDDSGFTWPVDRTAVHDADAADQFMPAVTSDPVTGRLYISWYDSSPGTPGDTVNRLAAASDDGGSWGNAVVLSDTGSTADVGFEVSDYGLHAGLVAYRGHVLASWSGNDGVLTNRMDAFAKLFQLAPTTSP
jgi:hypothetical protein